MAHATTSRLLPAICPRFPYLFYCLVSIFVIIFLSNFCSHTLFARHALALATRPPNLISPLLDPRNPLLRGRKGKPLLLNVIVIVNRCFRYFLWIVFDDGLIPFKGVCSFEFSVQSWFWWFIGFAGVFTVYFSGNFLEFPLIMWLDRLAARVRLFYWETDSVELSWVLYRNWHLLSAMENRSETETSPFLRFFSFSIDVLLFQFLCLIWSCCNLMTFWECSLFSALSYGIASMAMVFINKGILMQYSHSMTLLTLQVLIFIFGASSLFWYVSFWCVIYC